MASHTLAPPHPFPVGTSVSVYKYSDWARSQLPPSGTPPGVAVTTATVASDSTVTFTGLTEGVRYYAYAQVGGVNYYVGLTENTPGRTSDSGIADTLVQAGSAAAPAGGATLLQMTPPAGVYKVTARTQQSGTVDAVSNNRNNRLRKSVGPTTIADLRTLATDSVLELPRVTLDGVTLLQIVNLTAAGAGSVYHCELIATRVE